MEEQVVEVYQRQETGSAASRRLRAQGMVPAIVYGGGKDAVPIQVERRKLHELIGSAAGGGHAVFLLRLHGSDSQRHTMIRELDVDPITRRIRHVDFQRIDMREKVRVEVPLELEGVPEGVKNEGGVLDFVTREIGITCLPAAIPARITVEVSGLHLNQHVEAHQVMLPEGVELDDDPERVIASVSVPRAVVEAEAEEEELLEAELEEPEVIGRGREEEEEEEEATTE